MDCICSLNSAEEMKRTNKGCAVQAKRTQPFSLLGHLVMLRMPNVYITVCAFILIEARLTPDSSLAKGSTH